MIVSYIIAAVTAGLCALTYAELAGMFPISGSAYTYSYVAFGEIIAFAVGWDLILENVVAGAAIASGWSGALVGLLGEFDIHFSDKLISSPLNGGVIDLPAILITAFVTLFLYWGVKETARFNTIFVIIKVVVILLFVAIGASHIDLSNYSPFAPFGWKGVMTGAALVFFSFIGFDSVSTTAEEVKDAQKNVPRALLICLSIVVVLYVSVSVVVIGIIPYRMIDVGNALPSALSHIGIHWGSALVAVGAILGMVATLLVCLYAQIRIFMCMSRDGLLPSVFNKIHPRHKTPYICTVITGAATAVLAGVLPINALMELCNIGTLFAFFLVSVGIIVLRRTMPDVERKFKCPGVPITPLVSAGFSLYLMISLPLLTWMRFLTWFVLGLIIYFLVGRKNSRLQNDKIQ